MGNGFEAKDLGTLIPGFLGLGAQIGTAIPGLRKPPRTSAAEGAILAATTGAARAAAGAGAAGHGATRGLATREAGRQAQQVLLSAAPSIIQAANADEIRFQREQQARNQRLAAFGTQLGAGLSTLGAGIGTMVAPEQQVVSEPPGFAPVGYPGTAAPAAAPPQVDPATGMVMEAPQVAAQPAAMTQAPGAAQPAPAVAPEAQPVQAPSPQLAPAAAPPAAPERFPDLSPQGAATRAAEAARLAHQRGLDPFATAQVMEQYIPNPFLNKSARLNPYL